MPAFIASLPYTFNGQLEKAYIDLVNKKHKVNRLKYFMLLNFYVIRNYKKNMIKCNYDIKIVKITFFMIYFSDKYINFAHRKNNCATMVTKTRDKLIEVARQLFANNGVENTTMNDIANASEKGRRTIYTYFKNKKEIYNAVIEKESDQLVSKLREIFELKTSPTDKLRRFFEVRFNIINDVATQEDSLRRFFVRDVKRVDKIRRLASEKEREILRKIIDEGVTLGQFDKKQGERFGVLWQMLVQGVEFSRLRDNFIEIGIDKSKFTSDIIDYLIIGLKV